MFILSQSGAVRLNLDPAVLQGMTDAKLAEVCAPKAAGAAAFPAAHLPLVSQMLFSSTSAVWSQPAAGHYAAGNRIADGFGAAARAAGLPATSAQFGPFGGTGMAAAHVAELAAIGMPALDPIEVFCVAADHNMHLHAFCKTQIELKACQHFAISQGMPQSCLTAGCWGT